MTIERSNTHSFDWLLACEIGVEKAILVGNFQFWITENEKRNSALHLREGEYWTYTTGPELAKKYPYFKTSSIYRWLAELEKDGWIKRGRFNPEQLDKTTWYGRGDRFITWLISPNSQNEKSVYPSISQNGKSNSQNETTGSQNERSASQNENTNSQNERSAIYKDTNNNTNNKPDNKPHQPGDSASLESGGGGESEEEISLEENKKKETPPQPLPTAGEVRTELAVSAPHRRYAVDQLKIATTDEEYAELIEVYLNQQEMQARETKPAFKSIHDARRHFMNWLGNYKVKVSNHSNQKNGTENKRGNSSLRPTSIGQPNYSGTGSHCDVEL